MAPITNFQIDGEVATSSSRRLFKGRITFDGRRMRQVLYIGFNENENNLVSNIFFNSSKLNHENTMTPWFHTYWTEQKLWLICYDKFDGFLCDYLNSIEKVDPYGDPNELVAPWWSTTIRQLMKAIREMHKTNVYHSDLANVDSYILVGGVVKIINAAQNLSCPTNVIDDMLGLKSMLNNILLPVPVGYLKLEIELECNLFFQLFDSYQQHNDTVSKKLFRHPFLMRAKDRMACFSDIIQALDTRRIMDNSFSTNLALLNQYVNWNKKPMSRPLKKIYKYKVEKYDGGVFSLLRFLRNVDIHHRVPPDMVKINKQVTKHYSGFLVRVFDLLHDIDGFLRTWKEE